MKKPLIYRLFSAIFIIGCVGVYIYFSSQMTSSTAISQLNNRLSKIKNYETESVSAYNIILSYNDNGEDRSQEIVLKYLEEGKTDAQNKKAQILLTLDQNIGGEVVREYGELYINGGDYYSKKSTDLKYSKNDMSNIIDISNRLEEGIKDYWSRELGLWWRLPEKKSFVKYLGEESYEGMPSYKYSIIDENTIAYFWGGNSLEDIFKNVENDGKLEFSNWKLTLWIHRGTGFPVAVQLDVEFNNDSNLQEGELSKKYKFQFIEKYKNINSEINVELPKDI